MSPVQAYFYPDCLGRILLLAMDEILGPGGAKSVLTFANLPKLIEQKPACSRELKFPFQDVSQIQTALEGVYGVRAGQGLSCRIGQASYKFILREFGADLGLTDQEFRLLPLPARLQAGLASLADFYNRFTDQHVHLDRQTNLTFWHIENCAFCWERQALEPVCGLAVGFLQEALYSFSGGKYYRVEENNCVACGATECTILIDTVPMG